MIARRSALLVCAALGLVAACQSREPQVETAALYTPRLFEGLGNIRQPISTRSPQAQRYFDQGLALCFAFNHEAAIDAFREAARLDPECAICWWGVAFAAGPNINAPMGPEGAKLGYEAAQRARQLASHASPAERAWIDAIQTRYGADAEASAGAQRKALDLAFANAMREVHRAQPESLHTATLFGEALMDLSPWSYWHDDGSPREHTEEARATLESVLARDPDHIGAIHYAIHLYERFEPEKAEAAADRLAALAPAAGHLVHMPAHIYFRVGRYRDSIDVNEAAAAADVAWFSWCRAPAAYAALYYPHNLHFIWASAMMEGRSDAALVAARRLVAQLPLDQLGTFPFLEDYLVTPMLTLARFGQWDAVLGEPQPPAGQRYVTAFWHYARGLALARTGKPAQADAELAALTGIAADSALAAMGYDTSGGTAGQRLDVARLHLAGEIAQAGGEAKPAIASLTEAVRLQDAMPYSEPPPFFFPVRQALGAVLLEDGRARDAEAVYREDLRRHPKNGWSLYGLSRSFAAQGRRADAGWAERGFRSAWARADVDLRASRF